MGGRVAKTVRDGTGPVAAKRGREEAVLWARGIVAKGIRVVRLRSSRPAPRRPEPIAMIGDPQP